MRIITIVLGAIMLIGGIYCLFTPIDTYTSLSWLIGFAMLVEGVGSIVSWNERRKYGFADGWTLLGAIVSIALGCFLLVSYVAQLAISLFIAYLIAAWLVIGGITRIIAAIKLRSFHNTAQTLIIGTSWPGLLALGILVTVLGVLCLVAPSIIMVSIGIMLGLAIICLGIGLIVRGITMRSN